MNSKRISLFSDRDDAPVYSRLPYDLVFRKEAVRDAIEKCRKAPLTDRIKNEMQHSGVSAFESLSFTAEDLFEPLPEDSDVCFPYGANLTFSWGIVHHSDMDRVTIAIPVSVDGYYFKGIDINGDPFEGALCNRRPLVFLSGENHSLAPSVRKSSPWRAILVDVEIEKRGYNRR